jgi:DNA-binding CsgD family transcriptional regulator
MPYARKVGPKEEEHALALYAEGKDAEEIAEVLRVNPATVRTALRRRGVQLARGPRPNPHVAAQVLALHARGMTLGEIAVASGVPKPTVRQTLLREKAYAPGVAAAAVVLTETQLLTIADCFRAGSTSVQISNSLQIPVNAVRIGLKRLGLRRGHRGSPPKVMGDMPEKMVAMYKAGSSVSEVALAFNVGHTTATKHLVRAGVELRQVGAPAGEAHHWWKGGKGKSRGYLIVRVYPEDPHYDMGVSASEGGRYVMEHRLVMARHLGRSLTAFETVHHIDGNKENNALENLQLRQGRHGKGAAFVCALCGSANTPLQPNTAGGFSLQCADCDSHNVVPVPLASPTSH